MRAELAVLRRMVFGRSSERARRRTRRRMRMAAATRGRTVSAAGRARPRGPGARAGRRDYSHLPRVEVTWDFEGGGYCCPECGTAFTGLGDHVAEQLDWLVIIRVAVDCRRRYRRACACRVPATVTAPGPPKAIGKGLFTNAFLAMLLTERYVAGRSKNSAGDGAGPPRRGRRAGHAGRGLRAGRGAARPAGGRDHGAVAPVVAPARRRDAWRVLAPRDGDGPARWWLWVFLGADTACFVMDATRSGAVLARHAGIDKKTGQLTPDDDDGPRRLVISSDFYAVDQSAGKKATAWSTLLLGAHPQVLGPGGREPRPAAVLDAGVAGPDQGPVRRPRHAHRRRAGRRRARAGGRAAAARLDAAHAAWDEAITAIDQARKKQTAAPGLQEPARKALATLDREWDGLIAHRDYPMVSLDNYPDVAVMPKSGPGGGVSAGRGGGLAA